MTWALRLGLTRSDAALVAVGIVGTLLVAAATTVLGDLVPLALLVGVVVFGLVVAAFVSVPHVALAAVVPLYALLPAVRILAVPWLGPLKDVVALAAIAAAGITMVGAVRGGRRIGADFWILALVAFLIGLYVANLGGGERDLAWAHGVRLVAEPLLLLLVGLTLKDPRRTLTWAMRSLIVTAVVVALVGLLQQVAGPERLVDLGYEWNRHVRTINGHLRSFGTLDEPFTYAAFLMFGLTAVVMWMRPGVLASLAGTMIVTGLVFSLVRSSLGVALGIVALWLGRQGRHVLAIFLLAVVVAGAFVFVASQDATEQRTVQGGQNVFLTVNGRTAAWRVVFEDPWDAPLGKGVGQVGTAADRATFNITRTKQEAANADGTVIVDSGYFASVADVGVVGLAALLLLFGRVFALGWRGVKRGQSAGWLAMSFTLVLLLDAVTRESFTGFPTGFLGLLLIGVALAASREELEETGGPVRRFRPRRA